jgi:hypothetical protein
VASATIGDKAIAGLVSFLRGRVGRLVEVTSLDAFVNRRFVSTCTITGSSGGVSLFSKALWVKRLARWVGAGGNGICEGLRVFENSDARKIKSRQVARAAWGVSVAGCVSAS